MKPPLIYHKEGAARRGLIVGAEPIDRERYSVFVVLQDNVTGEQIWLNGSYLQQMGFISAAQESGDKQ